MIVKHIVMWRLKEPTSGSSKEAVARSFKLRLEALPQVIPEIRYYEVGLNLKDSERAADVVLYSEFDSLEALASYSLHPAHLEVVELVREIAAESRVVDYET